MNYRRPTRFGVRAQVLVLGCLAVVGGSCGGSGGANGGGSDAGVAGAGGGGGGSDAGVAGAGGSGGVIDVGAAGAGGSGGLTDAGSAGAGNSGGVTDAGSAGAGNSGGVTDAGAAGVGGGGGVTDAGAAGAAAGGGGESGAGAGGAAGGGGASGQSGAPDAGASGGCGGGIGEAGSGSAGTPGSGGSGEAGSGGVGQAGSGGVPGSCVSSSLDAVWDQGNGFNTSAGVSSLWADSPTDVWATTDYHLPFTGPSQVTIQHWDGTTWTTAARGSTTRDYKSIWASGPNDLWIATSNGLLRWNGASLADVTPFPQATNYMVNVWGLGPNDVWVGRGGGGLGTFHWDGATWKDYSAFGPVPPPSDAPSVTGAGTFEPGPVWGASTSDLWMAGIIVYPNFPIGPDSYSSGIDLVGYAHWDGVSWTVIGPATLADARLGAAYGISGSSPTDVWVTGVAPGFVDHFDGRAWLRSATFTDEGYSHVWASCPSNVWISGGRNSSPSLRHYDGSTWSTVPLPFLPAMGGLTGLAGVAGHDLWIGFSSPSSSLPSVGYVYHRSL